MDTAKAVKATAHQPARPIYALLTQGQEYVERGLEKFETRRGIGYYAPSRVRPSISAFQSVRPLDVYE